MNDEQVKHNENYKETVPQFENIVLCRLTKSQSPELGRVIEP